ncbi:hypothetical protein JAAARDRAFT_39827 [Jaapia argillacea MUCL 33604]|uniref:F-box domain-containing protein n=1 Tax=Jaapia argillacea MUCL 33604 TaxID=933084 RepID=A0A067PD89_9AGAM|nr:hypothetical protein JAAARDRAFT_39827 [Jaapia argillacea MUCL 33604]
MFHDRALGVAEICREVCKHIKHSGHHRWRADLANLSRCYRLLSNTALDVLWDELDSIEPLLKLLPSYQEVQKPTRRRVQTIYTIVEPIDVVHWTVFDKYSRRIHKLRFKPPRHIDPVVYSTLHKYKDGSLLPSLRILEWERDDRPFTGDMAKEMLPFLSPSLRRINILTSCHPDHSLAEVIEDDDLHNFLGALPRCSPSLENLNLIGHMPQVPLDFVTEFKAITSLHIGNIIMGECQLTGPILQELSTRPLLSHLTLDVTSLRVDDVSGWKGFPALRSLEITDGRFIIVSCLLDSLSTTTLSSFSMSTSKPGFWDDCGPLFESLARFAPSLRSLTLATEATPSSDINKNIPISLITPLLSLSALTHFHFSFQHITLRLMDADTRTLASSYPSLISLYLLHTTGLTVHSLPTLARHCPHLSRIYIDTLNVYERPTLQDVPVLQHGLKELGFRCSFVRNAFVLARVLDRVFPSLGELREVPKEVRDFILEFQAIREEEREREKQSLVHLSGVVKVL